MQDLRTDNTLLDIIAALRRNIFGILLVFVGVVSVATIYTYTITPIYEVQSQLLVKYGREYVYHSVEGSRSPEGDVSPAFTYNENVIINTEMEILKSPDLAEEVITSMGVEKIFPGLAQNVQDKDSILPSAVSGFVAMLDVYHVKGSNVLGVALQHQDPLVAVQAVGRLIERFKDRHLEIYKNSQLSFLEKQVAGYRIQLHEAEDAKKTFLLENEIISLDDQKDKLIYFYNKLKESQILENGSLQGIAESKVVLESELKKIPEIAVWSEVNARGNESNIVGGKYLELMLNLEDLYGKYPKNNRLVEAAQSKIDEAEHFIANQESSWRDTITKVKDAGYVKIEQQLVGVNASYQSKKKQIETIQEQMNQMRDQLLQLSGLDVELDRLNREVKEKAKLFWEYFEKLEDVRIQNAMDREKMVNVVVIKKPRVPLGPVKPRKKARMLVGLVLGATCSLFYCLVAEYVTSRSGLRG